MMGRILKTFFILLFTFLFVFAGNAYAIVFDLTAPAGELKRGQDVQFIVSLDTESETVTDVSIGMSFQNQYLEYQTTSTGNTMDQVTTTQTDPGTLILRGTDSAGFKGSGDFATVTFRIIADAPGSSEVCALFAPTEDVVPTSPPPPQTVASPLPTARPVCVVGQTPCSCSSNNASCTSNTCGGGTCSGGVCQSCAPALKSGDTSGTNMFIYLSLGFLILYFIFSLQSPIRSSPFKKRV